MSNGPQTTDKSYFPIVVRFTDTGEERAFDDPCEIPSGRPLVVIAHMKDGRRG